MSDETVQMKDYLVEYKVEMWADGERVGVDEITLRVAGVSELAAAQGGKAGLEQLSTVTDVEITNSRRDHGETADGSTTESDRTNE